MARLSTLLLLTPALIVSTVAHAETSMLDIIPHDALGAVAFKSVEETGKHLNDLSNDTNIRPGMQPAMGIQMALAWLGVTAGLDKKSPIAIILPDARKLKERSYSSGSDLFENSLVVVLPYSNLSQLARCFNASPKRLKAGETVKGRGAVFGKFFKVRSQHLYMGNSKKMVEDVVAAKSAATKMTAGQIKHANSADVLTLVGTRSWGKEWDELMTELQRELDRMGNKITKNNKNKKQTYFPYTRENTIALKKIMVLFKKVLEATDFGIFTIRYDKGLGHSSMAVFREDKTGERKKLLEEFRGSKAASSLNELPNDNLLFAFGNSAFTNHVEFLLRSSVLESLNEWGLVPRKSVADIFYRKRYLPFTKQFLEITHSRGAIYLNNGKLSKGWVSATSIIEPKQADVLLATLRKQAVAINPAGTDLHLDQYGEGLNKPTFTEEQIAKLIILLGDANFEARTSATSKLIKIGDIAVDALQKATKHRDKEIALRAEQLIEQMSGKMSNSRQEGLPAIFPLLANATYHYTPQAETINGQQIDIISLETTKSNTIAEGHFKQLLGTNWKHIRLVRVKNKIVMHWGSDTTSLQQTLKNIQSQKLGLANHSSLKEHQQFSSHPQKMQLHFSLTNLVPFFMEDPKLIMKRREKKSSPFSSFSITIDGEQLQIDQWIPRQDLINALKGQNFDGMGGLLPFFMLLR